MKIVRFEEYGGPLVIVDEPEPELQKGQLLIKMSYTAINMRDINIRAGLFRNFPPPMGVTSHILGNEGSGIVVASAGEQEIYPLGTPVIFREAYHLPHGGTWQEYVVATPQDVVLLPEGKDVRQAAALRTAYQSAYLALEIGGFSFTDASEQVVLATAVGSGTGNAALQIARAYGAKQVISTAGSSAKANKAQELGFHEVIDLSRETLVEGVKRLTNSEGTDVALDVLGGPYIAQALSTLKIGKTLVVIGNAAGDFQISLSIFELMAKRRSMRSLNVILTPLPERAHALQEILRLWQTDAITPLVDRVFPFTEVEEAQRYYTDHRPLGKVLLSFE
ncbi:quinone oxidoreductase family protein [Ktedonobacter racemifer]|uniref:Alcohol dehydrogenase zinc-binding domain protein n=1 Tax=Ktedonobacter racemifer DSM 44963 TaxID=485913 RepID=D6TSC0_KTERA|nr:zinc-binding alcohol dehydrogenase family protein [Ktedonobacter racemifer]EFH83321.1 Alcohol dehydrogenase zinc-binding domain protein [Ktedonobacter racemifer DSM 44963]